MKIMLVGGHYKCHFLTKSLLARRHEVVIINDNMEWCKFLTHAHNVVCVCGNGTKPFILDDANAAEMDAVVALTNKDAENLVICQLAKKAFRVRRTLAVVNDPKNLMLFQKLGVDKCISATEMLSEIIESETVYDELRNCMPLENGRLVCLDVLLGEGSPLAGKALRESILPSGSIIGYVMRDEELIIPNGDTVLQPGDNIIIMTASHSAQRVIAFIRS